MIKQVQIGCLHSSSITNNQLMLVVQNRQRLVQKLKQENLMGMIYPAQP